MSKVDFASKTVVELRKLAKTYGVTLGAGVSKTDIIAKLVYALGEDFEEDAPAEAAQAPAPAEAAKPAPAAEAIPPAPAATNAPASAPAAAQPSGRQTQYRAAWHNPSTRYNSRPAYQAPVSFQQRPTWPAPQQRPQTDVPPRTGTVRPASYTPHFGPNAGTPQTSAPQDEYRAPSYQQQPQRPSNGFGPRPSYGYDSRPQNGGYGDQNSYDSRQNGYSANRTYPQQSFGGYDQQPRFEQRPVQSAPQSDFSQPHQSSYYNQELGTSNPAVGELLAAGECADGQGVLEMHPDGYGFLRSDTFLPSNKDIYISMAQIRRFGLRTGDLVTGKTRPQREGDKYTAMLYITAVNGMSPDELSARPSFDELTPVYPTRRISLEPAEGKGLPDMRLVDLIAPIGFGQRGLILCQPESGKSELIRSFANTIHANHPEAEVMVLLIDENPEDVTLFREQVSCPVLASTFDQPPENHLRLADVVLERAQRMVEQKKDVVLIVDSLTRLAKTYTTTAAQQGRAVPGMVNPTSLFRAKKLFGAARCMKEGGSLTVIGVMNVATGNKVDDTVVEEFKGTANMELVLESAIARAGLSPAVNLQLSGTKRVDMLLTPAQQESLKLVRATLSATHASAALTQLLSMLDKTATNAELGMKLKDWLELMKNGRNI